MKQNNSKNYLYKEYINIESKKVKGETVYMYGSTFLMFLALF